MSIGCPVAQYLSWDAEKLPHPFPFVFSLEKISNQLNVEEQLKKYIGGTVSPL